MYFKLFEKKCIDTLHTEMFENNNVPGNICTAKGMYVSISDFTIF